VTDDRTGRDVEFTVFVRDRQAALVRFAWLVSGGSYADAEDLAQEALTRLYGRWRQVEDPDAYTRTVIARLNVSVWRKLHREVTTARHVDTAVTDERIEALGDDAPLLGAAMALPAKQRTAIVLRFWCDYSDEQVAMVLGCTPTTVRSHVHRGLSRLRGSWHRPPPDPAPPAAPAPPAQEGALTSTGTNDVTGEQP
jgi:RNA polymerase sigma-70 factor (sigma-E family)